MPMYHPYIVNADIYRAHVQSSDKKSSKMKNVLCSQSGRYYELHHEIKKAIYGLIVHAFVLQSQPDGVFSRTGEEVAIKVYSESRLRSLAGKSSENPAVEIAMMQHIGHEHPNLMGQIECCVDKERNVYSIMPFYAGIELFDHIFKNGRLEENNVQEILHEIIRGLISLHKAGIAHLDMSLENILYDDEDSSCVIIDYGMCAPLEVDQNGRFQPIKAKKCGKSNYMAPELMANSKDLIDPTKCDMWSIGICLLYLLLGFPPLEGASHNDVRYKYIVQGRLRDLLQHWDIHLSECVINLIENLLREDPRERLSAEQVLQHPFMTSTPSSKIFKMPSDESSVDSEIELSENHTTASQQGVWNFSATSVVL